MADWWQGGGESGGPSESDLRAAGFTYSGGDSGYWQAPQGWVRDTNATMGYAPPSATPPRVGFRPTTETLQQLTSVAPASGARFVETGEGGYTTYDYYDPASQAKAILAQPEKVTPDYIKQNFSGFERLPAATLQAMANDWRNAYAQLMKINAPEKLPEGYAQAVSRVEGGKPLISFGGPTEIFQEAAPYVAYDPQYGLIVPQQGIQPYKEKFGIMNLAPALMLGAAFGPLSTALGSAAGAGALTGALGSAINEGDIFKGALTGGITAGLGTAASPAISKAVEAAGLSGAVADAVKAGALAAGKAAITGGDPLQAALVAATGAGVGSTVGGMDVLKDLDPTLAKVLTAAASGAARAAVGGGDPVTAALTSAINAGTKAITSASPGVTTDAAVPAPSTQDILSRLGTQETEAQQLQQILADAGITPEQRGLLAGDYKQEGVGDVLTRGAESALGALVPSAQAAGQDRLVLPQPTEAGGAQPSDYKYFFDVMQQSDPQAAYASLSAGEKAAVDRAGQEFQASSEIRKGDLLSAYKSGELTPTETPTESWIDRGMLGAEAPTTTQDILGVLGQQPTQQEAMQKALSEYAKQETPAGTSLNTDAAIAALERATGQKIAAGDADILTRLAEQTAAQEQTEAALRGEISGVGTTFDKRLSDILAQQEEEQASMQTALTGYDKRILDLMSQGESEQQAMQQALAEVQASQAAQQAATQQQITGVQTGLGQQIGQIGTTLGGQIAGLGTQLTAAKQQAAQAQQQAGMGNLLAMLGMMQQKKQEAPPIPVVGEIKPFEFSTDLLEGIYQPSRTGLLGANDQLLKMTRG